MKNKILKIMLLVFMILLMLTINTYAVKYTSTDCTVKSEENITITIKASENVQNYDITLKSYEGLTYVGCSANENAAVNSSTGAVSYATLGSGVTTLATYTFKAPKVTEDKNYSVVFDINGTSNTANVKVGTEKKATATTGNNSSNSSNTTTTKTEEPNFTSVNKTMYATSDINLRSSWSTSSQATSIKSGTELKVTATSTNKVNGYVWYKVSYNGSTKYVASSLLTATKPEEKSNNVYLKELTIEGHELLPAFNKETTSYTMQVESDVTELNIKAEAEDDKASVEIQGNTNLQVGENTITISVNAQDNSVKIYEIIVTKNEKIELGLKSLEIEGTDIKQKFKQNIYEYEIDIDDVEKLEIMAEANDEDAVIEILGNENLQDGENTITIILSKEGLDEKVTYQIVANKKAKEEIVTSNNTEAPIPKYYLYIALGVVVLVALIMVIVYTIKNRKTEKYMYSDNYEENLETSNSKENDEEVENIQEIENIENVESIKDIDDIKDIKDIDDVENIKNIYNIENYENIENTDKEETKKTKIDYFLEEEKSEKVKRKKGKHF